MCEYCDRFEPPATEQLREAAKAVVGAKERLIRDSVGFTDLMLAIDALLAALEAS